MTQTLTLDQITREPMRLTANLDPRRDHAIQIAERLARAIGAWKAEQDAHDKALTQNVERLIGQVESILADLKAQNDELLRALAPLLSGERPKENAAMQEIAERLDSLESRVATLESERHAPR